MMRFWFALAAFVVLTGPASAGTMMSGTASALRELRKPTCAKADPLVWLNASATIYFPETSRWYGKTRGGTWSCESDAVRGGAQLAKSSVPSPVASDAAGAASPVPASSP